MTLDPNFQSGDNLKHPGSSLADEVIARHVQNPDTVAPTCAECYRRAYDGMAGVIAWPCDAYRLAVMVRDIEEWCKETKHNAAMLPTSAIMEYRAEAADYILAITKEET